MTGSAVVLRRALCIGGGVAVALSLAPQAPHAAAAGSPTATPSFATPVVVDNFRPGFEPTIAVDRRPGNGHVYASVPNGFSTTETFLWRSDDAGTSFHLTEGNAVGKAATCAGGGDTEIQVDPVSGALYFADLQGLTNFSTSVSNDQGHTFTTTCKGVNGSGVDRQWLGVDTNGGKTAVGTAATAGRLYLDYDNVAQQGGSNQLVMNQSLDGVNYGSSCVPAGAIAPCAGLPAVISNDEGLPGPIVVDDVPGSTHQHSVYAVHTSGDTGSVLVSICRGKPGDATAAAVATDCTDPTQVNNSTTRVNKYWHDVAIRQETLVNGSRTDSINNIFPAIAADTAGNLYATWSEYPGKTTGGAFTPNGPGAIKFAYSTNGGETWSTPVTVNKLELNNNVLPWITAGSPGRVAIAWYGAPQATNAMGQYGSDTLDKGTWNVYLAESTGALTGGGFSQAKVSDHQAKFGTISTQGLGGSPDRSLGDYLQVTTGPRGEAEVIYVDDTSGDRNVTPAPQEAAGPVMFVKQTGGDSLFATVGGLGTPPVNPVNSVSGFAGSCCPAFYSQAGLDNPPPSDGHLTVTGSSIQLIDPTHLQVTLDTADPKLASHLGPDPADGGTTNQWVVRWAYPTPGGQGDGNIFYTSMETDAGLGPKYFDGSTGALFTTHAKNFTYQPDHTVKGSIAGNRITWTVPVADVGGVGDGSTLNSVSAFTLTAAGPSVPVTPTAQSPRNDLSPNGVGNLIDTSPPYTVVLGTPGTNVPETPWAPGLALLGAAVIGVVGVRRRHAVQLRSM
ncbi:MAG: hypothetical protein JF887_00190 [Candidatus Dormibacteraeota bacterium]|uniref:Exo-alpha-sialidase n=1 Tax=Candidatus Amunia macphersoniae TaxID=3127014 RepID=A0A934NIC5_9BACT|nr:hypothetical protein [Candidatus Dormibacteraeota bacterium]